MDQNIMTIPVFINNFNLLTYTKSMIKYLENNNNLDIIIIDNASTYEPLLDYYNECPHKIIKLNKNMGAYAPFSGEILSKYKTDYFIVTDPDLDLNNIPLDYLDVFYYGLKNYSQVGRCGFSLEINDVPRNITTQESLNMEQMWWKNITPDKKYFLSMIDTTFALYRKNNYGILPTALRTNRPYTAKHIPWYINKDNITEEYLYYIKNSNSSSNSSKYLKQELGIQ
jgi:hypothetical protein